MVETVLVQVSADHSRFSLKGGDPKSRDEVHAVVTAWPGWKRINVPAVIDGLRLGHYQAPAWTHTAAQLSNTTMRVEWGEGAHAVVADLLGDLRTASMKLTQDLEEPRKHFGTDRRPMRHQAQAVEAIRYMERRVLLADDMGLGKTSASLWASMQSDRILILCPASVKFNWQREVKTTLDRPCYVIDGTPKKRANVFADLFHAFLQKDPCAVVINYDLLIQLSIENTNTLRAFVLGQALICDESHYLKSRDAARTKWVMKHLAPAKGGASTRILCTGTPVRNLVDDLYSQIEIVRPGTWTSYWDFAKRYLDMAQINFGGPRTVNKIVGTKNLPDLNKIVNTMQIRRLKEQVIDLPPKIHTYPELELSGDHLKVYKAMKDLAVLELSELADDDSIFSPQARSAVIAALRCEQIAQGFVGGVPEPLVGKLGKVLAKKARPIPGRPKEIIFPDSPKMVWILENIKTLLLTGKRPVIFSRFNAPLFWLAACFEGHGKHCPVLHGALTSVQKAVTIDHFQQGIRGDMLFCQVKMAEGFNLHTSNDCIFLGREWSPAINAQAEDRLHRIGQNGTVNVQIPIVRNTIEQLLHDRLADKSADANQALKHVTVKELIEAL